MVLDYVCLMALDKKNVKTKNVKTKRENVETEKTLWNYISWEKWKKNLRS